ncbi:MAG: cytochrome c, partial [Flavobacteriales bacterium]|nr:cytochrome c [Flavobacteriales bacterium]
MLRQSRVSRVSTTLLSAFFLLLFAATPNTSNAQKDDALYAAGEKVFKGNCASCHKPDADMTGPALKGSRARWEGKGDIYAWIKNSTAYRNTGNSYANEIFAAWKNSVMTPNAISNGDIDAVLHYVDYYEPKVKVLPKEDVAQVDEGDNSLVIWLLIIGLLFTVVALSVGGVKRQLDSALSEQAGKGPIPDSTGWQRFTEWCGNHKYWASIIGIFLFCFLVTKSYMWAMDIGVYGGEDVEHYRPSQPIAFDHTLHAGAAKDN